MLNNNLPILDFFKKKPVKLIIIHLDMLPKTWCSYHSPKQIIMESSPYHIKWFLHGMGGH